MNHQENESQEDWLNEQVSDFIKWEEERTRRIDILDFIEPTFSPLFRKIPINPNLPFAITLKIWTTRSTPIQIVGLYFPPSSLVCGFGGSRQQDRFSVQISLFATNT
jgi:hypothetical protein